MNENAAHEHLGSGRSKASLGVHVLALVALGVLCWVHQRYYDFNADDAFISYRYASHWASGDGPVFNVGERVEGYSNFLWVCFLAAARRLGFDIVAVSRQAGALSCLAVIVLIDLFLVRTLRRNPVVGLGAGLMVALHAAMAVHARSGLETLPLTALVLGAQMRFLDERRTAASHWASGVLMGAVAVLRADGIVFALPVLLILSFRTRSRRETASFVTPLLLLLLPHLAWRFLYYGDVFPNTFYARMGGGVFQLVRGSFYLYKFVTPFGGWMFFALPLLLLVLRDHERDEPRAFLGLSVVVVVLYVIGIGGDYLPMGRFLLPIVPAVMILQLETILELWRHVGAGRRLTVAQTTGAGVVCVALLAFSGAVPTAIPRRDPHVHVTATKALTADWSLAGRWFGAHFDSTTTLAAKPVGALSYYSGLHIIDMLGTNDPHIAHVRVAHPGHGTAGHEKSDWPYVLSRRPQLIFERVSITARADCDTIYGDGSVYGQRCVDLGLGFHFDALGHAWRAPLYLWYAARRPAPPSS